jgi:hypothetical protein
MFCLQTFSQIDLNAFARFDLTRVCPMIHHRNQYPSKSLVDGELKQLRSVMLYDASSKPLTASVLLKPNPNPNPNTNTMSAPPNPNPMSAPPNPNPMSAQPEPMSAPTIANTLFRPALNQDPLFWCLYIMKNGAFKYEQLPNRFTAEQDGKRDEIMALRQQAKQLKQSTGIKFTASTIEGDIMSQRMSLHAFRVLVCLNSLNAVFVNPEKHVYAEFINDAVSDKPTYILERNSKTPKCVSMESATDAKLASMRATHYRIENPQKPVKAVSAYTVAELTETCHELKIQLAPKMKKQELYDLIVKKLIL